MTVFMGFTGAELFLDQVVRVDVIAIESRVAVLHDPGKMLGSGSLSERRVVHERDRLSSSCGPADVHVTQVRLLNVAELAMDRLQKFGELGFAGNHTKFLIR